MPGYGESKARAAELAAGGAIGLLEGLKDQLMFVRRDADAGIGHPEGYGRDQERIFAAIRGVDAQGHGTVRGKLDGIGQEVFHHLQCALGIQADLFTDPCLNAGRERQPFLIRHRPEDARDSVAQLDWVHILVNELLFSRFDLGEIQDVVDQAE